MVAKQGPQSEIMSLLSLTCSNHSPVISLSANCIHLTLSCLVFLFVFFYFLNLYEKIIVKE
uniref:Uncharacterized protein n=1 Tax=Anguilla anguilla TaxID=7936 RepID=A0A0E9XJF4_ANGAN